MDKQNVFFPFAKGIDTKTDPKSLSFGDLLELENGVFSKTGAINKRFGYDVLARTIEGSSSEISTGDGLCVFGSELLAFDGTFAYSRLESTDHWMQRGRFTCLRAVDTQVVRNSYVQSNPSVGETGGIRVVVWEDSRGGIRYSVLDTVTGALIVADAVVDAAGSKPQCIVFQGEVAIFYATGTSVYHKRVSPLSPTVLSGFSSVVGGMHGTHQCFDVAVSGAGTRLYVGYGDTSDLPTFTYILSNWTGSGVLKTAPSGVASSCLTICADSFVYLVWGGGTTVAHYAWDSNLAGFGGAITVIDGATTASRITMTTIAGTLATVFWETTAATPLETVRSAVIVADLINTASAVLVRSVGLAGKAFTYDGDQIYFVGVYDSTLQSTYFVFDSTGRVVARLNPGIAGGLRTKSTLSAVTTTATTGIFSVAGQVKGKLTVAADGTMQAQLGVNTTSLDFVSSSRFQSAVVDKNLIVAGGVIQGYDGVGFTEHGFHLFPEGVTGAITAGAFALLAGTYQWRVVYEWTDNFGQVHRSAQSQAVIKACAAGDKITLTIPTLRITAKSNVGIAVYRTAKDGSVFYRVNDPSTPLLNDTTVDTVTYVDDTVTDTQLAARELLYTTGEVLDAIAPGACTLITSFKGRAFVAGMSDANQISFSTSTPAGEAVYFNDALTIDCDPLGGPITALGVLDDKLIIFKGSRIFAIAGNGPTNTGDLDDYGDPELLTTDVGCTEPKSVVLTPQGLMFKSSKGIYLLDRQLGVQYVGAPVEAFNTQTITGAVLVPSQNHVRFVCSADKALVYDYLMGQWSTFTNHTAVDCDLWGSTFVFLKANGKVYSESSTSFVDGAGTPIALKFVTSWLNIAGMQGFQRVWRAVLLGDYKGRHQLRVRFGYDYHPEYAQELTIDSYTLLDAGVYGGASPYGSGIYGGVYPALQFDIHLAQQKCQSIRVSIEDTQSTAFNEGYSLSGIAFQVGVKAGTNKLRTAVRLGSAAV